MHFQTFFFPFLFPRLTEFRQDHLCGNECSTSHGARRVLNGYPTKENESSLLEYIRSQYFSMQRQSVDSSPFPVKMSSVVRCKQLLPLWDQDCLGSDIKIIKSACTYIYTYIHTVFGERISHCSPGWPQANKKSTCLCLLSNRIKGAGHQLYTF